jgi:glycosyltransferase involved in cell wall biosynthesis
VKFVVVGGPPGNSHVADLAKSLGVRPFFIFAGPVQRGEIPAFYAAADIFVSTSLFEAFGLAILEAMASGKPVIASKVGAIPEIVIDTVTGHLFPPGNPGILADLIIRLLSDKELRITMGQKGRERARLNFAWDVVAKRFDNLYETLCQQ